MHPALDAAGARFRIALARALMQVKAPAEGARTGRAEMPASFDLMMALLSVALQGPDKPGDANQEALRIADEILAAKEGDVPFEVRAQALAIKGLWTKALTTYVDGLRPLLSRDHADGLKMLVESHPALSRPTSQTVANPLEAEKHYATGLRWYFDRKYGNAEQEFKAAVEQDGRDARYYYFLGLSRLLQDKRRDAMADFEEGAMLERKNRPPSGAVNDSLERVQGALRQQLNAVREQPR
jgi:tetratricopeptide (TPR) repeat protein